MVLFEKGAVNRFFQTFASGLNSTNRKFLAGNLNDTTRMFAEGLMPAMWGLTPRANKHAFFYDYGPDTNKAMRLCAGPDSDDQAFSDSRQHFV